MDARGYKGFQSTLPVRGATQTPETQAQSVTFQSTLPVRGATQSDGTVVTTPVISIHAPRAGSDSSRQHVAHRGYRFQSTLPVRGATYSADLADHVMLISIHAPRAGSDHSSETTTISPPNFNPRSPCGERPMALMLSSTLALFQSTLPVRGATVGAARKVRRIRISIHAPRAGSDHCQNFDVLARRNFNPRSPCGERRRPVQPSSPPAAFQSTLPVRGATRPMSAASAARGYFNPRSPCGERHSAPQRPRATPHFNPRSPCGERQQK